MPKARGMEAVLEKAGSAGKKRPMFAKKGANTGAKKPGMAIMIAIGNPKKGPPPPMREEMDDDEGGEEESTSSYATIARLKAKIAELEAKLAEYEGGGEGDEAEDESEDESEDEEMGED